MIEYIFFPFFLLKLRLGKLEKNCPRSATYFILFFLVSFERIGGKIVYNQFVFLGSRFFFFFLSWRYRRKIIFFSFVWHRLEKLGKNTSDQLRPWHWKIYARIICENSRNEITRDVGVIWSSAKIKCATARNKLRLILGTFQGFHPKLGPIVENER